MNKNRSSKKNIFAADFPSLREVVRHLTKSGYKVSKSKISRDKGKNLIKVNDNGTVLETEVRAYAATLERITGNIDDLNDIHAIKTSREVERLELQNAKLKFEYKKEQGKYIPRVDFEAELAARAAVFDSGFRQAFSMHAQEWIVLVNGKVDKAADFLDDLNRILDEQLTEYARINTFHILFEED